MKIVAIVLNFILLGSFAFELATASSTPSGTDWFFVILIVAVPICSLIALFGSSGDSWLALYFKRKALEEKNKIERLNENTKS